MDQFLLFGDSITQQAFTQERGSAFGAALSDVFVRRLDVVNRGFSGYNTRQALKILPQIIPRPEHAKLRFMTVFFGANDARLPSTPGGPQQHIPLEEYTRNLKAIISHPVVRAHENTRLILVTPPPVDERKSLAHDKAKSADCGDVIRRKAAVTAKYAQAVRDIGVEHGVPVLDIWQAMVSRAGGLTEGDDPVGSMAAPQNGKLQSFLSDGLHLSMAGYQLLYQELMALLEQKWPSQAPEKLRFVLPSWDDPEAWVT